MDYAVSAVLGLISGLVFYYLAIHHVSVRSIYDDKGRLELLKNKKFIPVWMFSAAVLFMVVVTINGDLWDRIRIMIFIMLAINVTAVDMLIRRIPNALLLSMLLLQVVNIIVLVTSKNAIATEEIGKSMVGLLVGYFIFTLPAIFKLSVGAGDVKYSAVIGFTMGIYGYMQAMAVMAVTILVFYLYLKITKTGNMKTAAPMAPFLSMGTVLALLIPML